MDVILLQKDFIIMKLNEIVNTLATLEGVIAVAIVDYESGMIMASKINREGFDLEVFAASGSNIIGAKKRTIKMLDNDDYIHDIVISMTTQYHLLCPSTQKDNMFIYVVLDRETGNLSSCRRMLFQAEKMIV